MEDLLAQLVKEATGPKLMNLKNASQNAYDKLQRQHGTHRDASYELRAVCLTAIQMALETKRPKFVSLALNGMHRVIKDERFSFGIEPEDDSLWLPAQLLRTTSSVLVQGSWATEETLVNILRLFLSMACSPACTLNGRLLIEILSKCGECWESGSRAVRAASLAAASQCLRTFCAFLKDETEDVMKSAPTGLISVAQASAVYNEVIPVMQWLCSRLIEPKVGTPKKSEASGSLYLTECILTLTTALPKNVQTNPHFTAFLWQKFCPTLAAALGSPGRVNLDKKFTYKDALHIIENETRGFFTNPGLETPQARCIYLTAIQLLRIAGAQNSLRPMLEALFHRMLLLPLPQNRSEPLKCVKEIFRSPARLVDLSVILYMDKNQGHNCGDDMALFRLIIDAMEECALSAQAGNSCEYALQASVECIVALLESLQTLCSGNIDENALNDQTAQIINNRYATLKDVDYTGPLTYQYMARLPAPYRDAVAELRENGFETSSGSDSELDANDGEIASTGSGDTEGPEECHSSSDENSSRNEGNWPYSYLEAPTPMGSNSEFDRQHAREFTKSLANTLVPKLLKLRSSVEVDESIQEFASNICQENSMNYSDFDYNLTAINADGIYLATYSALLLGFQLMKAGHYENSEDSVSIPLTEQQFVTSVQNTGVLVYLSTGWLCELYQSIIASNPMIHINKDECFENRCALIELLQDAAGIGQTQMLSEWQRLQNVGILHIDVPNPRRDAANKLARRLLTCCWESMVTVLSTALDINDATSTKNKLVAMSQKTLKFKKPQNIGGEALFALSLEGLHAAATLSNSLNLQHLAGKILSLLATNVCSSSGSRITASTALSMDVVLSGGLELGSYSPECWNARLTCAVGESCWIPIFSVCRHVTQIEHDLFSLQNTTLSPSKNSGKNSDSTEKAVIMPGTGNDKLNLSSCPIDDDETCVDVYSFLQTPLQNPSTNVASILKNRNSSNETLLSQADTAKVLCTLSHQAENLFADAADRLCLPALLQFTKSLCRASRDQLYRSNSSKKVNRLWWPTRAWKQKSDSMPLALLLHRVGDVTLRVFRSSRPLLHILKVWAITGPHLMDAACHKDRSISKRAIEYIQDVITSLLVEQTELPHFHFNEALLKPFENLLSMETCDIDVQDQIVACLYEIVEAHRTEIRSGWRPLFGTLRNARNRPLNTTNIIDIFRVFLESDNTLVFANAGLDCILCLLSYLDATSSHTNGCGANDFETTFRPIEFLHEILKFLERCASILSFMYNMPKCPNFHSTHKIKGIAYTHTIDANIPNSMENFTYFGNDYLQNTNEQHMISYRSLHIDKDSITKIDELDKSSGVCKVWFLLLDGLTNALIVCSVQHQSAILQCILKLFKNLQQTPGIEFSFYCINHLLIPMLQDWLRYVNKTGSSWQMVEKNFKHCCGMTTDLVVDCIEQQAHGHFSQLERIDIKTKKTCVKRPNDNLKYHSNQMSADDMNNIYGDPTHQQHGQQNSKMSPAATLTLKQILLVLIECSAQPQESIARVSVSCLKHVILSTGHLFNEMQWLIACSAIHRSCTVTVAPLRQLSFAFHEKSNSFYGDCATVKVAARRDSTIDEIIRINALAQQVFLMDNQRDPQNKNTFTSTIDTTKIPSDDRSYSFLLYPLSSGFGQSVENFVIRIPYRSLVIGLLANQMLLPLVAKLLLGNLKCVPAEVHSCIFENISTNKADNAQYNIGFRSREILLRCIKQYLTSSLEFDCRPGLKFLIQKIANIDFAANLYKQMTSSWMIYFVSMVDSYLVDITAYNLSADDLNYILKSCSRVNTSSVKKKENFVRYLFSLQDAWNLVCEIYLNNSNIRNGDSMWQQQQQQQQHTNNTSDDSQSNDTNENSNGAASDDANKIATTTATTSSNDSVNHSNGDENDEFNSSENGSMSPLNPAPTSTTHRTNPFDVVRSPSIELNDSNKSIAPEIEQQRASSILKDLNFKRLVLSQLVIASMELLQTLPKKSAEDLRLLMTPTIREAFRLVQLQDNELKLV